MRPIFDFLYKSVICQGPWHNLTSLSNFGFEFAETFEIENWLPTINDTGSRRDADSAYQW